ncbi:MAG: DAK2 domain-containing protein [Eggerthellaceae bacterium]
MKTTRTSCPPAARHMFAGCLAEMQDITNAQVGDKTMMDAIPAVEAAQACEAEGDDAAAVFAAAAEAAEAGARASEGFASKFGRARSYGDATIGTPDAGAVSTSLFLRGLATGAAHH